MNTKYNHTDYNTTVNLETILRIQQAVTYKEVSNKPCLVWNDKNIN